MSMFGDLKIVSQQRNNVRTNSNNSKLTFSFRIDKSNRKVITITLSPQIVTDLGWENQERVFVLSDGKMSFGIGMSPPGDPKSYKLVKKLKKNNEVGRYEIALTWKEDICLELKPQAILEDKLFYKILREGRETGLAFTIPDDAVLTL